MGTVVAAVAKNFTYLLVGRSIQGVGGGGLIALSEVIVTDLVPLRLRGQYFGILSAMWSVGSVTGPILGGGFAQDVSWVSFFSGGWTRSDKVGLTRIPALDILHQLPLHRSGNPGYPPFPQAQHHPDLPGRETPQNRLRRHCLVRRQPGLVPDPVDMGRCSVPLEFMADPCPSNHRRLWPGCVCLLRG